MSKIRKAVIPAAGYGTGFLPATKAQPKELLPIVDKPIIQFIVEEAFASGIEEILIITGKHKRAIEDHFDSNPELEDNLESKGKTELLKLVKDTTKENLFFVRQSYPKGLGNAIGHARAFVNDEPFVVLLGDNIIKSDVPATKQLIDLYEKNKSANLAVVEVPEELVSRYGVIDIDRQDEEDSSVYTVKHFVEKPSTDVAPSNLAIAARYVLTPEIFDILDKLESTGDDELQLTDAIEELNKTQRVFAKKVEGTRFDVGDKMGFMRMSLDYGLEHDETAEEFKDYLIQLSDQLLAEGTQEQTSGEAEEA